MNSVGKIALVSTFLGVFAGLVFIIAPSSIFEHKALAQTSATPVPAAFDQKAALVKLREQIKGRENEPAEKVFKNVTTPMLKSGPASRLLAVMEFGYARSLGVNCAHCHVPDKWESEDKAQKQIARDMSAMVARINGEMLKGIKNIATPTPTINCTTCHRGEVKPALNLPVSK
jgi:hypothetical protein